GDRVFITGGAPRPLAVNAGCYRLRLLNGSNARIFKLAWSDGAPVIVLGSDGGLLAAPAVKPYVMVAPGERVELWADFGGARGDVRLDSLAFAAGGGMAGMGGGMMGMGGGMGRDRARSGPDTGAPFP